MSNDDLFFFDNDNSENYMKDWYMNDKGDFKSFEFNLPSKSDPVNSPSHYTKGKVDAIDVIEDAIKDAPNTKAGFLQGQVLKYLLRLWYKSNSVEDAKKAEWYLKRLIDELS